MIVVRFESGLTIQYNTATYVERIPFDNPVIVRILTAKDGHVIAYAPIAAVIEWVTPCRVYNALAERDVSLVVKLEKQVASLTRAVNKLRKVDGQ